MLIAAETHTGKVSHLVPETVQVQEMQDNGNAKIPKQPFQGLASSCLPAPQPTGEHTQIVSMQPQEQLSETATAEIVRAKQSFSQ